MIWVTHPSVLMLCGCARDVGGKGGREGGMCLSSLFSASLRSDYSEYIGGHFRRIGLKIVKKCWLYLDIFSCV